MKAISEFIKEIQNSDDATKRRWLVVFSGSTMALVVALWVLWMSTTIPRGDRAVVAEAPPTAGRVQKPQGFFSIMGAGVSAIWDEISARLIRRETFAPQEDRNQQEDRNFITDDLLTIPPTPLP